MNFLKSGLIPAICLTIALSGCGGEEARKASFLEKGKTYLAEGNYDKAKIEFKNVLQIDPKYAEGYYMMGLLEEKRQNLRPAFANYKKATELDPTDIKAQAKLGKFYLISGNIDKAKETLATIVALDPQSIEGKLLKLIIMARTEDKSVIPYANELIEQDPTQVDAIRILAALYMKDEKQDKAITILKKGIDINPDNKGLRRHLATVYAKSKDFDNTEKVLQDIISLDPENLSSHINLALFYSQLNKLDKAENQFRKIISLQPNNEEGYLLLTEFQARRRSVKEAEKTLLSAIEKNPKLFNLRFALARLYKAIKSNKEMDVYHEIIKLGGSEPEGLKARNELAKIALSKKDLDVAGQLINEVLDNNPRDNDALLIKGKIAFLQKDYDGAISTFRTVIKEQPGLVEAVTLLTSAHFQNNEPELAKEVLRRGIDSAPDNPEMYINYAYYLEKSGETEAAEKIIDELLKISPKHIDALKAKVKFAVARQDMDEVRTRIEKIRTAYPENPEGYQQMGDYYAANKQYKKAFEEYESALKRSKTLLPALASITKLHLLQKQYSKAVARLNKTLEKQPENAIPHELLGEVYIAQKKFAKAEKEIRKAIDINNKWPLPYTSLASLYLAQKDIDGAIRVYQKALEALPKDTQIMAKLAQIYERQADYEKAMRIYENILAIEPDSALAANNLAATLADKIGDPASLQRAKKLAMRFEKSTNPGFLDTIGWIYYKTGEHKKAVPILEKVVEKAANVPIFQYHMGMAYFKTGNKVAAKTHLNKALEGGKKFQGRKEAEQVMKSL